MLLSVELAELATRARDDAEMDFWSFEDANVIVTYSCSCPRCVN